MNKKGFVLIETLVVTIFTLFIFTVLYNSVVPLLGKYEELSFYDDVDTTYDLYHVRKMVLRDTNYLGIKTTHYQLLRCYNDTLAKQDDCNNLFMMLDIDNTMDEVIFLNMNYVSEIQNDSAISSDIKNYLKYVDTTGNILLLQNDGYVSYLNLP